MTLTVRNDNDCLHKREIGSVAGIKANFHREYLRQDLRASMYKLGPVRAKIFFPAFVERQTCPGDIKMILEGWIVKINRLSLLILITE